MSLTVGGGGMGWDGILMERREGEYFFFSKKKKREEGMKEKMNGHEHGTWRK